MQTIPEIINIAKISGYLADNAVDANKVFVFGSLDKDLPKKIYMEYSALEWSYNQNYVATGARGSFLISGNSADIQSIIVSVVDPVLGLIVIGTYNILITDTTNALIATGLAAAITGYGYSAFSADETVYVTAPIYESASINGVSLSFATTLYPPMGSFDYTFDETFS
jgi:hypothetical protein